MSEAVEAAARRLRSFAIFSARVRRRRISGRRLGADIKFSLALRTMLRKAFGDRVQRRRSEMVFGTTIAELTSQKCRRRRADSCPSIIGLIATAGNDGRRPLTSPSASLPPDQNLPASHTRSKSSPCRSDRESAPSSPTVSPAIAAPRPYLRVACPNSAPSTGRAQMLSRTASAPKRKLNCGACWQNTAHAKRKTCLSQATEMSHL